MAKLLHGISLVTIITSAGALAVQTPSKFTDPCGGAHSCSQKTPRDVAPVALRLQARLQASFIQETAWITPASEKQNKTAKKLNLCIDGRVAPELVLYGPARASTSTFAANLVTSPDVVFGNCTGVKSVSPCPDEGWKEMHFYENWDGGDWRKKKYLEHFPWCTQKRRILAADLTPGQHVRSAGILEKIENFYGDQAHRVSFVMLLREPLECMQSFYHFEKQEQQMSFEDYCTMVLRNQSFGYHRYFNNVLYADALEQFIASKVFKPWQLTIIPMRYNLAQKNGYKRAREAFWALLDVANGDTEERVWRANSRDEHVEIEKELSPKVYTRLKRLLDQHAGASVLAKIITEAWQSGGGPLLYGYKGNVTNATNIVAWLKNGW